MEAFLEPAACRGLFRDGSRPAIRAARIRGGLEADAVHLVTATGRDAQGRRIEHRYVRKVAAGTPSREAGVYRHLGRHAPDLAPRLLHAVRARGSATLYLEHVEDVRPWPWSELEASAAVLERIARLHELPAREGLPAWDYEGELAASAGWTLAAARRLASTPARELVRDAIPAIEEVAAGLGVLRGCLRGARPFAGSLIHGDLHPGNVLYRTGPGAAGPVFIDWARARIGSALEDVSTWLQSLSTWEPEARRRHDTLFSRYLAARGLAPRLTSDVRDLYWFAAASNALAGALAFHLATLAEQPRYDPSSPAACAARAWLRALRQARARLPRSRA
jgi:hypothetical protein